MEKLDARTLTQDAQEALRRQIVTLRSAGRANKLVAATVGVSEAHCSTVWSRYRKNGAEAVAKGKRGRRHGDKRSLTAEQEATIKRLLVDRFPQQLTFSYALWNREVVQLLIMQQCGFLMPIRTIGEYLKRWGLTTRKPGTVGKKQSIEAVTNWLVNDYPEIAKRARAEKAEIYWGYEAGIQTGVYGEKSQNSIEAELYLTRRQRITLISAITNQGKIYFMLYRDTIRSKRLLSFMRRLIRDAGRKVFLILENSKFLRSEQVRNWLVKQKDKIEVFCLPTC